MTDPYTLTAADIEGARQILAVLEETDRLTGGYSVGQIQGHRKSATATAHYEKAAGPMATADAMDRALNSPTVLGLLCKKLIAHADAHPEHITP